MTERTDGGLLLYYKLTYGLGDLKSHNIDKTPACHLIYVILYLY